MAVKQGQRGKSQPSWIDVKRKIASFDHAGLIHLVSDLYGMNPDNKAFLHARLRLGTGPLDDYKRRIRDAVAPNPTGKRFRDPSASNARRAISEYKKAIGDVVGLQELRLCWCESAAEFAVSFGFENEGYFDALIRQYRDACLTLAEVPEATRHDWLERLIAVRDRADIGYGVQDAMDYWLSEAED